MGRNVKLEFKAQGPNGYEGSVSYNIYIYIYIHI